MVTRLFRQRPTSAWSGERLKTGRSWLRLKWWQRLPALVTLLALAGVAVAQPGASVPLATVTIGIDPGPVRFIPPKFMGLSHEWGDSLHVFLGGVSAGGVAYADNLAYRRLLGNLSAYGSTPVHLRIGGNSTDSGKAPNLADAQAVAAQISAGKNPVTLGVNLGLDNVELATSEAADYTRIIPAGFLDAIEIGNEPDDYPADGYRSAGYIPAGYFNDLSTWALHIMPVLAHGTKLMGPSFGHFSGITHLADFLSHFADQLSLVSQHMYAITQNTVPPDFLLQEQAAAMNTTTFRAMADQAHSWNIPFRLGEFGTASGNGIAGISNGFQSALWIIDVLFRYVSNDVDGVNFATPHGSINAPFIFTTTTTNGRVSTSLAQVNPVYYGMLLFQQATQNQSRLLPIRLSTAANLQAYATIDMSRLVRLVLINKEESASGTVTVTLPKYHQATVYMLTAPSYTSSKGVTFAGQTFDGSMDGSIRGLPVGQTMPISNHVFQVSMPATSAALVMIQ